MNYTNKLLIAIVAVSTIHAAQEITSVFNAIRHGDLAAVQKYINSGGNINVLFRPPYSNAVSPLEWAVLHEQAPIIKEILTNPKSTAQLNIEYHRGHEFINGRNLMEYLQDLYDDYPENAAIVELFIKNNLYDVDHLASIVILATLHEKFNFLNLILHHPRILNSQDSEGDTIVLSIAKEFLKNQKLHYSQAVKRTLAAGADITIKNNEGLNFIDYTKKYPAIKALYQESLQERARENPYIQELLKAAKNGKKDDIAAIEKMIAQGANINSQNEAGITPLMRAAQNDNLKMVEFLLSQKANPNSVDAQGMTALEWALHAHPYSESVQERTGKIINLLLKAGAKKTKGAYKDAVTFGYPEDIKKLLEVGE